MTEKKSSSNYKSIVSYQSETMSAEPIKINNEYALEVGSLCEGQSITISIDEIPALIKVAKNVLKLSQVTTALKSGKNELQSEATVKAETKKTAEPSKVDAKKTETAKATAT